MTEKILYDWNRIEADTLALAEKLRPQVTADTRLIAVARGGLVPAGILCQALGLKCIHTICICSYDENDRAGEMHELSPIGIEDSEHNLFIDDLIDSGGTLLYLQNRFPKSQFATIYSKPHSPKIGISAKTVEGWIVFPWEIREKRKYLRT